MNQWTARGFHVKVEVKTFNINGRIIFTSRELHESAISKKDYYLIGILDKETPQYEWPAYVVQDPISLHLQSGKFDIQAKLQAPEIGDRDVRAESALQIRSFVKINAYAKISQIRCPPGFRIMSWAEVSNEKRYSLTIRIVAIFLIDRLH